MRVIYYHGNIVTMDEKCPNVTAILIEDGVIQQRGNDEVILKLKDENTKCIDLMGKTMLPSFIDGHSHFSGLANALTECQLSNTHSFEEIIHEMKRFIVDNHIQEGQWVIGSHYDHNFLEEKEHPDKHVLDEISIKHPIVIVHASSHMGVANTLALSLQELNNDIVDPQGGHYGRYDHSYELNGYMEENAFIEFRNHMPMIDVNQFMKMLVKAQDIYASYGITTIQEGMVTKPLLQLLKYASNQELLKLDLVGYIDLENARNELLENKDYLENYIHHFKIGGYKVFLDGSPQGRTAWMLEPYLGEKSYCGYPTVSDQHLYALILTALKDQQQLLAHCNGDAAAHQYISQFQNVIQDYPELNSHRSVMIHAQFVTEKQLQEMLTIPLMPSFFVAHTFYWGDIHIQNFGMHRAAYISPTGSAVKLGMPFTFHQDTPVLMPDMLETIWCATQRQTRKGVQLAKNERIDVYEALKAVTVHAAYQYHEEDKKGTIDIGKLADLVILDQNPLTYSYIKDIQVLETIKEGKTIYKL